MSTSSAITLDPRTYARGLACVHCGLCLPACPTYTETFNEADSPRGRIQLMLALSDGTIQPSAAVRTHLDLCLDCRGCETACPSGVVYHELIEETRTKLPGDRTLKARIMRWFFLHIFTKPRRLRLFLLPAQLFRRSNLFVLLPINLRRMTRMLPTNSQIWPTPLPASTPAAKRPDQNARNISIAFFPTCIGSVLYTDVNQQAIDLLSAAGCDVMISPWQTCCGAIHQHNGAGEQARQLAKRNIDAMFPDDGRAPPDFIVTSIAGCGAMLREYDFVLRDDPRYASLSKIFVSKVRDISEALLEVGVPAMKHPIHAAATYHDACHLIHAQHVASAPRQLLAKIPGLRMVALPESDICCGAAGTYNLQHPPMAAALANRKLANINSTNAAI
ncbi:MAG TPA: heterodisulfide reductase-related iron-sulfur binding cluster, partial [Tepidisphaeraceae bacterium]